MVELLHQSKSNNLHMHYPTYVHTICGPLPPICTPRPRSTRFAIDTCVPPACPPPLHLFLPTHTCPQECEVLYQLQSPHIVSFVGLFIKQGKGYILMVGWVGGSTEGSGSTEEGVRGAGGLRAE